MNIEIHIDNLMSDLEDFQPDSLGSILRFTRKHPDFFPVIMLVKNLKKSADYLYKQGKFLYQGIKTRPDKNTADIQLASIISIFGSLGTFIDLRYDKLASRISKQSGNYHWSKAMAATYLLHKNSQNEKLHKST